jgi:hypothetical protein
VAEQALNGSPATGGPRRELAIILLGGVIGMLCLYATFSTRRTNFEDMGLGLETTASFARLEDRQIHCVGTFEGARQCIEDFHARADSQYAAVWLGNSQLHGINQMREGDETAPAIAHRHLKPLGIDLIAVSRGNMNPEEHLVWVAYLSSQLPLRALVLPVVFVSLRRPGVHSSIAPALDDPRVEALLRRSEIGRKILDERLQWGEGSDLGGLEGTVQERTESLLVDWLEDHSRLWDLREEARGNFFKLLHSTRNRLLRIEPGTRRTMLFASYERNMSALGAILDLAKEAGFRVLVYVAPLRHDVDSPYIEGEYARFKVELKELADRGNALFEDLDTLVPGEYWGNTDSTRLGDETPEIDYLHFRSEGHVLLAGSVEEVFERGALWDAP